MDNLMQDCVVAFAVQSSTSFKLVYGVLPVYSFAGTLERLEFHPFSVALKEIQSRHQKEARSP